MIIDLHAGNLDPTRWGSKASNLAAAASARIAVPPGLCLWPNTGQAALDAALDGWLLECRSESLIVRSSTSSEDGSHRSGAGRSLSIPSVATNAQSVGAAVESLRNSAVVANLDLKSVIVQEELIPSTSGVAFLERKTGQLIVEADKRRFAVTDGSQVSTLARMDREGGVIIDGGTLSATEASSLYAMAQECADVFGFDPDIEWGCVAGALVVFQVRPITVPVQ